MAFDIKFYENVDALASAIDDPERMASLPEATLETMVLRNASLQARYFILGHSGIRLGLRTDVQYQSSENR